MDLSIIETFREASNFITLGDDPDTTGFTGEGIVNLRIPRAHQDTLDVRKPCSALTMLSNCLHRLVVLTHWVPSHCFTCLFQAITTLVAFHLRRRNFQVPRADQCVTVQFHALVDTCAELSPHCWVLLAFWV
jgi:hypothetical protein